MQLSEHLDYQRVFSLKNQLFYTGIELQIDSFKSQPELSSSLPYKVPVRQLRVFCRIRFNCCQGVRNFTSSKSCDTTGNLSDYKAVVEICSLLGRKSDISLFIDLSYMVGQVP